MIPRLSRVVLMVRQGEALAKATEFYHSGLGLEVVRATDDFTELQTDNLALSLQGVLSESKLSTGYSPMLTFEVKDMDSIVATCCQLGGHLDGPIQYPAYGKIAAMRAPCGHMIGIFEPVAAED
mmetsp:Transcript_15390/g.37899  ORF Transcript_15390/g.37899 Transcript_15390/m.37899 type:complete len:124 (+) Transcript_15390:96-467(+)